MQLVAPRAVRIADAILAMICTIHFSCPRLDNLSGCIPARFHHTLTHSASESCLANHLRLRKCDVEVGLHHVAPNAFTVLVELNVLFNCFYFKCHNSI